MPRVILPKDEQGHPDQAIEWWYYNGFLQSKTKRYAFMTCLFKADKDKVNLKFLRLPVKTIYFSHSLLYDLETKKVRKEILPFVLLSKDSFRAGDMYINYMFPLRTEYTNHEMARYGSKIHLKTSFFDLWGKTSKPPLLENQTGFIDLGEKSTYYYTYPRIEMSGTVGTEAVTGLVWHDRQWSDKGFMKDSWLWFSFQLADGTDIVCFDYKGKKMATISSVSGKLKTTTVTFEPVGKKYISKTTGIGYHLSWRIVVDKYVLITKPVMSDCEMVFGFLNYWEGPLTVMCNGKPAQGFMELLADKQPKTMNLITSVQGELLKELKSYFSQK